MNKAGYGNDSEMSGRGIKCESCGEINFRVSVTYDARVEETWDIRLNQFFDQDVLDEYDGQVFCSNCYARIGSESDVRRELGL
jgi:hypothetical protein